MISQGEITTTPGSLTATTPGHKSIEDSTPGRLSLTQYPFSDSSLANSANKEEPHSTLSQYPLTQYPLTDSNVIRTAKKEEPHSGLSQYPPKGLDNKLQDTSARNSREEKSDMSPAMAMYETRPGTAIERPVTDGHNDQDDMAAPPVQKYVSTKAGDSAVSAYRVSHGDNASTKSGGFDYSIKFPQYNQSIGDSEMFSDKQPISSSTPIRKENETRASVIGRDHPTEYDWSLKKLPISQYVSTDDRAKMLGASFSAHRPQMGGTKDTELNKEINFKDVKEPVHSSPRETQSNGSNGSQKSADRDHTVSHTLLPQDLVGGSIEHSGRVSDPTSLRSTGSLEQFTFDPSVDTSICPVPELLLRRMV